MFIGTLQADQYTSTMWLAVRRFLWQKWGHDCFNNLTITLLKNIQIHVLPFLSSALKSEKDSSNHSLAGIILTVTWHLSYQYSVQKTHVPSITWESSSLYMLVFMFHSSWCVRSWDLLDVLSMNSLTYPIYNTNSTTDIIEKYEQRNINTSKLQSTYERTLNLDYRTATCWRSPPISHHIICIIKLNAGLTVSVTEIEETGTHCQHQTLRWWMFNR